MPNTTKNNGYVSIAEAAEILGVSVWTVRRRIADGTINAVRVGRLIRIKESALELIGEPVTVPVASDEEMLYRIAANANAERTARAARMRVLAEKAGPR